MVKTIRIDGKEVSFRASASVPRMYRMKFKRDIMKDLKAIQKAMDKDDEDIPVILLESFENMAYIMAKHADQSVPDTVEDWLDQFETFSIYEVFPTIAELWMANMETTENSKKKRGKRKGS